MSTIADAAYIRTLRDIAEGHITLYVDVDRYDPLTGRALPTPVIRTVHPDRMPAGGMWKHGEHWWEQMIERGHLALADTGRGGQAVYLLTPAGWDALRRALDGVERR